MKFDEFEALVQTYGADEMRWPVGKQVGMRRIVTSHPEQARKVLESAQAIDAALDRVPAAHASDLLKSRIQKSVQHIPQSQNLPQVRRSSFGGWARLAAMIAVSFSAGFAGAQFVDLYPPSEPVRTEIVASVDVDSEDDWAMAATELGFTEIYEWTSGEDIDIAASDL